MTNTPFLSLRKFQGALKELCQELGTKKRPT